MKYQYNAFIFTKYINFVQLYLSSTIIRGFVYNDFSDVYLLLIYSETFSCFTKCSSLRSSLVNCSSIYRLDIELKCRYSIIICKILKRVHAVSFHIHILSASVTLFHIACFIYRIKRTILFWHGTKTYLTFFFFY